MQEEKKIELTGNDNTEVKSVQAEVQEMLNSEQVTKNCQIWADFLLKSFGKKWFTIQEFVKKAQLKSKEEAMKIATVLILKGNLYQRQYGVHNDSKYKVCLAVGDKIALMEDQLKELDIRREVLLQEINTLKAQNGL